VRVFFDSSAFVKRYVEESGTDAVLNWCDQATEIGLSAIALPEIVSAFCRLRREDKINDTQYRVFISADQRQRDAALRAGLRVQAV